MSIDLRPFLRIAGSVVGLLAGGLALGWLLLGLFCPDNHGDPDEGLLAFVILAGLGLLVGGTIGAAVGATIMQKSLRQRSSFWKALLGAAIGLLVGIPCVLTVYASPIALILIVAGAVIGSGSSPSSGMTRPQQGVISPSDTMKQQPGQAKCPFCHSTTFRVEEEAGLRRCSDCHSVLPSYIQGNR